MIDRRRVVIVVLTAGAAAVITTIVVAFVNMVVPLSPLARGFVIGAVTGATATTLHIHRQRTRRPRT